jgi:hypothetical protein
MDRQRTETVVRVALGVAGAVYVALGLWQAFWPGSFHRALADFGARNDHTMRDVATFYLALGAGLLVAVGRPSWRVPVLAVAVVQSVLHALNHVADSGKAHPSWVGPFDAVTLSLATVALVLTLVTARRIGEEGR